MAADKIDKKTRIKLKKIAGIDSLTAIQITEILQKSSYWIHNFYAESAGDKKVKGQFAIEGFSYGGEFDLSTSQDILDGKAPPSGKVPFLFLSDLVNFVEQIRTSLSSNKISLSSQQRAELDKLGDTFKLVGVNQVGEMVSIEDLQRIEDVDYSRRIVERIKLIYLILKPSIETEKNTADGESVNEQSDNEEESSALTGIPSFGKSDTDNQQEGNSEEDQIKKDEFAKNKEDLEIKPDQPIKISELDANSKLYIQSLSIITINQALSKYFNAASLEKLGLPPGTVVTFDHLPYEIRKELMDRSFLQVEGLLLSGEFSLEQLIKEQSQRIIFSNQAALNLLMDIHGLKLLNQAVRDIAKDKRKIEQILRENGNKKLSENDLKQRSKNQDKNVTDTNSAQEILEKGAISPNFAKRIESELDIIETETRLEDVFSEKIRSIIGQKDNLKIKLIVENVRPIVEVFIQQGLPPEYLIPDPRNFDYNRFVNIFGNSIDREDFNKHKEELAHLIIFYWKRKRAIWAREIRAEFGQEKYTPEEAAKLYAAIKNDPKKLAAIRNLGILNFTYGGAQIAEELGETAKDKIGSIEIQQFEEQQKKLIEKFLEEQITKLNQEEQQKTLKVYFEFYMPGEFEEYNINIFQTQILPQINPMDFYMLQAAEQFGPGAFDVNGNGYIQRAFGQGGDYQGTGLMDSALGQQGKKLAAKALGEGLYYALDAAGGWGEALRAAEAAAPIIKKLKEKLIEIGLEKVLEFLKKHWPWILALMALGALASMLPWLLLLAPAGFAIYKGAGSLKNLFSGAGEALGKIGGSFSGSGTTIGTNIGQAQQGSATQYPQGAKTLMNQFSSSAMITAGQAVVATVGAATITVFIYQTSLNSAFLTDFPKNESEISSSIEKTSKYAEISKTAVITDGCPSPENNGAKCENPSFPISIEYTVTIKPKEDFSLQITNINDLIKFKQSQKGWEEAGQTMPSIETERELNFDYFKKIIAEQGGLSNTPLSTTPIPTIGLENSPTPNPSMPAIEDGVIVIPAGGSLTFTYTLEDLDSNYNHTAILNTIEANFYYQNDYMSGTDNVITAARVCLGNCSAGAGCWPTTGHLSQMPYGDFSHSKPPGLSFMDAYDIGCNGCSEAAIYGPPVYAPFDGQLCFGGCRDSEGCFYTLSFSDGSESQSINFLHFEDPNPALSTPNQCMQVEAGFMIGLMGTRGFSTGVHLHYGAAHSGVFYMQSNPGFSIIETLVPEDDSGNYPPKYGANVTTCY